MQRCCAHGTVSWLLRVNAALPHTRNCVMTFACKCSAAAHGTVMTFACKCSTAAHTELCHDGKISQGKPVCGQSYPLFSNWNENFVQLMLIYEPPFLLLGYSEILRGYTKWKETCEWDGKEEWESKVHWGSFKSKERNKGNQGQFSKHNLQLCEKLSQLSS